MVAQASPVKSRVALNLILALLVMALALVVALRPKPKPQEFPVSQLQRDAVTRIALEMPGSSAISLEKRGNAWFMVEPHAARTEPGAVDRVLDVLGAASQDRFEATDLARFELDRPVARVRFNDESITFGMVNPITGQQYAQGPGGV